MSKAIWEYVAERRYKRKYLCPFYQHGWTLIPAWISYHRLNRVWGEIAYPFPNLQKLSSGRRSGLTRKCVKIIKIMILECGNYASLTRYDIPSYPRSWHKWYEYKFVLKTNGNRRAVIVRTWLPDGRKDGQGHWSIRPSSTWLLGYNLLADDLEYEDMSALLG